jgi:integrase
MISRKSSPKKAKGEKFPLTIKAGSSSVKIYRESREDGSVYYKLSYHLGGKRHRPSFADLDEAKNEATAKAAQLSRGDIDAMQLNGSDRLAYGRALEAVRQFNVPLDAAAIDYASARKVLGNHSLMEAAQFFIRHNAAGITGKSVTEAFEEFKKAKTKAGLNPHYLRVDIGSRCGAFAEAFKMEVRQLTARDVNDYLYSLEVKGQTANKHADSLGTFFRFCQSRKWLAREVDLFEQYKANIRKDEPSEIEIYTPKELRLLLDAADPEFATCIAIQAFAGIRSEELQRLTWDDLQKREGFIELSAAKAKTASRRLTPILENLAAWLKDAPKTGKLVWPHKEQSFYVQQEATVKAAQEAANKRNEKTPKKAMTIQWKHNALRHSFISYRIGETQNVNQVALEAGTSVKKIDAHYRELVTPKEATEWFGIRPAGKKIHQFSKAA